MAMNFLEFEQPIAELEAKIEELRFLGSDSDVNLAEEIKRLQSRSRALTTSIFSNLSPWQITQLARHPQRPYTLDYVSMIFTDWHELHGDRMYGDDLAVVGGLARLEGMPVMLIGEQKGRDTKERVRRNYGMPKPEGYRKALRLMFMAERFRIPVITLIDTPGAYPGIGSEERGQSEAIARNLFEMSNLSAPVLSVVIGEGGSGGALAIGVCDRLVMLQFSVYSVISPESCASILWKSTDKKEIAADAMGGTAERLKNLGLVDEVLKEPHGGAHRDPQAMAEVVKESMVKHVTELRNLPVTQLLDARQARLRNFGVFREDKD
jgi:acetyl-CoA carboxylase carboxyl transferase subunit alpha